MKSVLALTFILLATACNSGKFSPSKSAFVGGTDVLGEGPILTGISPSSWGVTGGGTVSISGTNLSDVNSIYFGGEAATSITNYDGTLLIAVLPAHAAEVVNVVAQNSAGQSGTLVGGFSYNSFLYSSNQATNNITAFIISSATGALTSSGTIAAPAGAYGAEVDPTNQFFYTAGVTADQIGAYSINPGNGSLTLVPGSPFTAGDGVNGLVFSNNGAYLYASNFYGNSVNCFAVNPTTGALTMMGTIATGTNAGGITLDPTDQFLYVANNGSANVSGYSVGANCSLTAIAGSPWAAGAGPDGITVHPNGLFVYVGNATANTISIFSRNTSTGVLTLSGTASIPAAAGGAGAIIDSTGTHLYANSYSSGKVTSFSINTTTGSLTTLGTISAQPGTNDIRIQSLGQWVFTANTSSNSVSAFVRDIATGVLTAAATPNVSVGNSPGIIAITDSVR